MSWLLIPSIMLASLLTQWDAFLPLSILMGLMAIAGAFQLASGRLHLGAFPAPLSYLLITFGLWAGLSSLWSDAPFDTWRATSVWLLLPVWAWIISSLDPAYIKKLLAAAACVIVALSVIAFAQLGSDAALASDQFRAPSLFANPNTFATLIIVLLLPVQHVWFARAYETGGKRVMLLTSVILVALFTALVLTISRIALGAYIGLTILQIILERKTILVDWRRIALYIGALVLVYFALNYTSGNDIVQRLEYSTHPISRTERLLVWDTSWQAYLTQPLLGHGFGALYVPYAALRHPADATFGQFAHSDALQFLAELGPFGLLLAAGISLSFLLMTIGRLREGFKNHNDAVWFTAAATGLLACFGSALVTYVFYLPVILLLCALLLGLWACLYWIDDEKLANKRRPVSALVFLTGALLLTGFHVSALMTQQADISIRNSSLKYHLFFNEWASRLSFRLNPAVTMEWADVLMSQATQDKKAQQFDTLDAMLAKIEELQPAMPALWLQKARLSIARHKFIEAEANLQQALRLDPAFLPARIMLGRVYRESGRDDQMIADLYQKALDWRVTEMKYGVKTQEQLRAMEDRLPRLLPADGKSR